MVRRYYRINRNGNNNNRRNEIIVAILTVLVVALIVTIIYGLWNSEKEADERWARLMEEFKDMEE